MARRAKKNTVLNFKGVEGKVLIPQGDYPAKVVEVSQEKGNEYDYFKWTFEITSGKYKGKKLYTNTSHNPAALWNLANLLTALGVEVPQGEMEFDLTEFVDMEVNLVVDEEDYNGKPQSRVVDYYPADGEGADSDDEDEDEDEKPAKGKKSKAKSKKDEDEDDEEEEKPARGKKAASKKSSKKDDDEDEEDEDEEEDEKPARGRKGKKKPADDDDDEEEEERVSKKGKGKKPKLEPVDADTLDEMDEDELGDIIERYSLDVDLDDFKTMKKKIAAVKSALEDAEMLAE